MHPTTHTRIEQAREAVIVVTQPRKGPNLTALKLAHALSSFRRLVACELKISMSEQGLLMKDVFSTSPLRICHDQATCYASVLRNLVLATEGQYTVREASFSVPENCSVFVFAARVELCVFEPCRIVV